ncbi:MAG: biotin/lipoyl-binding protein [Ruminococcus sp.]|nr:biotin/lipoyl-binding protein [Ruminococcus sp.]
MKKLIIFLLCIAILGGGGWFGIRKYKESKQDKKIVDVVPVTLMAEPSYYFEYYSGSMSGNVVSANSQKILVDNQKLVKNVFVEKGQTVKKGDVILEYDMTVVELELAQKENQVKVIEQNIKNAEKELETLKTLRPSEEAPVPVEPVYPEEPDYPDEPEYPEEPEVPEEPVEPVVPDIPEPEPVITEKEVTPNFTPVSGRGTKADPFVINCSPETKVTALFMQKLKGINRFADLYVYENNRLAYVWSLDPEGYAFSETADWIAGAAVNVNSDTGLVYIDDEVIHFGSFKVVVPKEEEPEIPEIPEEPEMPEEPEDFPEEYEPEYPDYPDEPYYPETPDSDDEPTDMNYMYSRAQLASMIRTKENDIKQYNLALKSAELEFDQAKKRKDEGKVVAQIDGVVKKIGSPSDEMSEIEEYNPDIYDEPEADSEAFAVIEGEGGLQVSFTATELDLDKMTPGTLVTVQNWMSGSFAVAEIVNVEPDPVSYTVYDTWSNNPNNSMYLVKAQLYDTEGFGVGDWVDVSLQSNEDQNSTSVYLPKHYVRQEGSKYYVMKDDGNGKLVKQYVRVGKTMWDVYIEVKGGLTSEDKLCFPYGKDVVEGVKTRDSEEVIRPEGW